MSFAPLQKQVDDWISTHTHGYFTPLMMLARLTEELGELSRAVSHRHGEKRPKPGEAEGEIRDEIADLCSSSSASPTQRRSTSTMHGKA